jgi:hypothetical protein
MSDTTDPVAVVDDLGTPLRAADVDGDPYDRPTITLTTHTLGLDPYVLIQAIKVNPSDENDDGLRLKIEHGGGSSGAELAALFVLNLPADQNPLTAAIKAVLDANAEHPDYQVMVETLVLFADFCDVPMPESGR